MAIDLKSLWDFDNPAQSEERFRSVLATATGDDAVILPTQSARTYRLRADFTHARPHRSPLIVRTSLAFTIAVAASFSTGALAQSPQAKDSPPVSAALSGGLDGAVVFRLVADGIAVIRTNTGKQGSAVAMANQPGRGSAFATNCHILAGATEFTVNTRRAKASGLFIGGDPKSDACMVFAPIDAVVPDTFNALDLLPGEKVYAIGAPRGLELSISEGIVSAKRGDVFFDPPILIQITAPISPGSSGGGLFDARARLVGITTFLLKDAQNLNFAIAINEFNGVNLKPQVTSLEELTRALRELESAPKSK